MHLGIIFVTNQLHAQFVSVWHIPDAVLIQFSWWWAHGCPKHVENRNKHTWKRTVRQAGYLQRSFYNLDAGWGWWSTPGPGRFTPRGKTQYPLYRGLGEPQARFGQVRKISLPPIRIRSADHRTRSESLYRLSYLGPTCVIPRTKKNDYILTCPHKELTLSTALFAGPTTIHPVWGAHTTR